MAEKLGKRIGALGQNVWRKAQDAYDIVRINNDAAARSRELADVYEQIGRAYCAAHKGDTDTAFPALCEKANTLMEEIAELNGAALRLKGRVVCPACGREDPLDAAFCPACGAELSSEQRTDDPMPEDEPAQRACRTCGATLDERNAFCPVCGAKQDD